MNRTTNESNIADAEFKLRAIAALPAPDGLEDRVHAHLRHARRRSGLLHWPRGAAGADWMRSAAAAAIVCVVAGGGWTIYAHVMPGAASQSIAGQNTPDSVTRTKSFSTGEAIRRPQTLNGPMIPQPVTTNAKAVDASSKSQPKSVKPQASKLHEPNTSAASATSNQ